MRVACVLVAAILVAGTIDRSAEAVVFPFNGSLALQISTLPAIVVPGSGSALVNGSGGAGHLTSLQLAASAFRTTGYIVPVTDPALQPIVGLQLTAGNGSGAFAGVGGAGFGGVMPLAGVTRLCLFAPCSAALANLTVPLGVIGAGGTATVMGVLDLTVIGAPWTTQTAAIGAVTAMGAAGPASNTGAASGTLSLVTPVFLYVSSNPLDVVPTFAFLNLHFVPEPGTIVLLGSGIGGLVAFARRRKSDG